MNIDQIEELVQDLMKDISPETFIYQLLAAYGKPKASITRLQKGNLNLSKLAGEIIWKKNLLFRVIEKTYRPESKPEAMHTTGLVRESAADETDIHILTDQLRKSEQVAKHGLRFVVVTDFETLLAADTKTGDTLDIPITALGKHFDFFLPWSGQEKHRIHNESQADIKAAYRMAKLYDEICKENPGMEAAARHSLNVFLSRILFCFFAEDTDIFPTSGMFTSSIASHTQEDGTDLDTYLDKLFDAMNKEDRSSFPAYIQAFPYVNGGLFADSIKSPKFSRQARKILIECGELDWSEINPDIFGSMIQAVVHPDQRSETGMHYTSVSNIMKVIEALFLNDLREEFEENEDSSKGLEKLLQHLYNVKVLDPACGSGNFLIIAYKELRKLEMQIYERLREINIQTKGVLFLPQIRLTQFYGIELDDFAHEIAILSLWLAEHQMNVKFRESFGQIIPPLPLKQSGHIVCGNATRLNWSDVCPKDNLSEVYVLGNPPYLGARNQDKEQKEDMAHAFAGVDSYKKLDYIACWFYRGASYIKDSNAKLAFVTTNSICQGELVAILWPLIFEMNLEIGFAHRSFKWTNNAKHNAGVTVAIIGLRNISKQPKFLFSDGQVKEVTNINAYLANGKNTIVEKRSAPLSRLQQMSRGNGPTDDGNFMLTPQERAALIATHPETDRLIKRVWGANEFIKGIERWCLWMDKDSLELAESIPFIKARIEAVEASRLKSPKEATQRLASVPYRFDEIRHQETTSLIIPTVTSEDRDYVPVGFLGKDDIIIAPNQAIYDPEFWVVAILSSRMHNVWIRAVAGRLEERIRYSIVLCYNTFPLPDLTEKQKESLSTHIFNMLAEREKHPEKTIGQLYEPEKMPRGLLQAHLDMDAAVERCYRSKPFLSDDERLDYLFKLYEEMAQQALKGKESAKI